MICETMPITAVVGEQRGDEGKGRFVDMLMPEYDIGARFGGGDNAGHTVVSPEGNVYKLHGMPSSIVHEHAMSVIGNGTVINAMRISTEMDTLREQGVEISPKNLLVSGGAHLTLPHHIREDEMREEGIAAQGSTKSGIAPVYGSKAEREGLRAEIIKNDPDKLFEVAYAGLRKCRGPVSRTLRLGTHEDKDKAKEYVHYVQKLGEFVTDTALYLNNELAKGSRVLAEGAQAFLLDIDHGMYPFTTSSNTTIGGVATGLGVPIHKYLDRVVGVSKAIQSHVGEGPFVTEIRDPKLLEQLHGDQSAVDAEHGTTTGRTRRLGYLDLPQIRRAQMINGTDEMALTKLDWVPRFGDTVPICVEYSRVKDPAGKGKPYKMSADAAYKLEQCVPVYHELPTWDEDVQNVRNFNDLPENAKRYIEFIEDQTGTPIKMIGVGPGRDQVIVRD